MNDIMTDADLEVEMSKTDLVIEAVTEAVRLLDSALDETGNRGIVSASEISDLLLDVRLVLAPLIS